MKKKPVWRNEGDSSPDSSGLCFLNSPKPQIGIRHSSPDSSLSFKRLIPIAALSTSSPTLGLADTLHGKVLRIQQAFPLHPLKPSRVMVAVNESMIKGYTHASISSKKAFEWTLRKIVRDNTSGFKLLLLHAQVQDEDGYHPLSFFILFLKLLFLLTFVTTLLVFKVYVILKFWFGVCLIVSYC
ncbi:uncharacterized protein LOC108856104 [Raphanus sativus]|uniref:Uncharacterized protein LOC108856104 n=1 Tax=Raphanus sativus TaxID=3726 RepID=A0A9W3DIF8_RAPSA|nr:uncharacterized protein LOC108856104 [Raphanus sativus]